MKNLYHEPHLIRKIYTSSLDEQAEILKSLNARTDTEAERLKQYIG